MKPRSKASEPGTCLGCEHRTLRMFCNLSDAALNDFDRLGQHLEVKTGTQILHEGDPAESVAVICDGQVKLSCTSRQGRTLILKIAVPGDVLGLGAVMSRTSYETTAEAIVPTVLKRVAASDFLLFLEKHGQASLHAAQSISNEYKTVFFDARRLALSPTAAGRLASVLLDWGRNACCGKSELRFRMALTQEDLSNFAGTTRETVSRTLNSFQKDKLIAVHGSFITILDPVALARLC